MSFPQEVSHCLLVMNRAGPLDTRSLTDDGYSVHVKGDIALDVLVDRLVQLSASDVRELLQTCSEDHMAAPFLCHAFKQHAIRCISLHDPNPAFHLYAPMSQASHGLTGESPAWLTYRSSHVGPHLQKLPGLRSRRVARWRDTDSEPLSDTVLYIPTVSSDALFDAFFVDCDSTGSSTLWILRMTVCPAYETPVQGCQVVAKLVEKLETERLYRVEVKYLLVVPREVLEESEVAWAMETLPEGLSRTPCEVFICTVP